MSRSFRLCRTRLLIHFLHYGVDMSITHLSPSPTLFRRRRRGQTKTQRLGHRAQEARQTPCLPEQAAAAVAKPPRSPSTMHPPASHSLLLSAQQKQQQRKNMMTILTRQEEEDKEEHRRDRRSRRSSLWPLLAGVLNVTLLFSPVLTVRGLASRIDLQVFHFTMRYCLPKTHEMPFRSLPP